MMAEYTSETLRRCLAALRLEVDGSIVDDIEPHADAMEALERRLAEPPAPCIWRPQDNGEWDWWEADCGGAFSFEDGDPDSNEYRYCPHCGHPIMLVARTENVEVDDADDLLAAALRGEEAR